MVTNIKSNYLIKTNGNTHSDQYKSRYQKIKNVVLVLCLIGSIASLGYVYYFSYWKMYTGYGDDPTDLLTLEDKDPKSLSAGDLTHFKFGNISFEQEAYNLHWKLAALFDNGDGVFERPFSEAITSGYRHDADGLGPLYNAESCEGCHIADGRAAPPQAPGDPLEGLLFRISIPGTNQYGGPKAHPVYGTQLADKAIKGHLPEVIPTIRYEEIPGTFPDGTSYRLRKPIYTFENAFYGAIEADAMTSPRIAPAMIGMGLLDAISTQEMIARSDPEDKNNDGISGEVNWVWNHEREQLAVGKYGWKAETATLRQQIADAAINDMGISNAVFTEQNCTAEQTQCLSALNGTTNDPHELTDQQLNELEIYLEFLAVPARDPVDHPVALKGENLFSQAGCNSCHFDTWTTGDEHRQWRLRNQVIHPYTDLLLHDLGAGLADHRPTFNANGREWRTAPLWGIGMTERVNGHTYFLHDGRARNLEEAILWHGGEAENAKQTYMNFSKEDRESLITFLKTL